MTPSSRPLHQPVLCEEVVRLFSPLTSKTIVDGTVGLGGHSEAILRADDSVHVLGVDRDLDALDRARTRLATFGSRFLAVHGNFRDLDRHLLSRGIEEADGILLDLGVSSLQIDTPERGFSFRHRGPLDMRMDRTAPCSAGDWLHAASEDEIRRVLHQLGEERYAGRVARALVVAREEAPIRTTDRLTAILRAVLPSRYEHGRISPATRTFQALRMQVNEELPSLEAGLRAGFSRLSVGGVLVAISFHSLEDRLVKQYFRTLANPCTCPPELPECLCHKTSEARILTPRPLRAGEEEIARNPRSRSAKLRAVMRSARPGNGATDVPEEPMELKYPLDRGGSDEPSNKA
jgi:16S rRNA (cytosine1402-N4)-methyltransferase